MRPRKNLHKPVLVALAGVAAVLGLGWAVGPEGRAAYARLTAPPRPPQMPPEDARAVSAMVNRADFHHEMTDANWAKLKAIYARNHHDSACFGPMRHLPKVFAHRDEAIAMLEGYLREGHRGGNLVATAGLRSLDAPGWQAHADALRVSDDPETRNLARRAFGVESRG